MITDEMGEEISRIARHAASHVRDNADALAVENIVTRRVTEYFEAALAAMPQPVAGDRDWHEDRDHENGNYMCRCVQCGNEFTGYKRRVVCKVCSLASPVQGATAVKGLEWYPDPGAFPHNTWGAQSSFGRFIIEEVSASDSPAYEARYTPHHLITIKDSLEDAKAAAQTDFERRVRSCLTAPTAPSEEDDLRAAREAVKTAVRARMEKWAMSQDFDSRDLVVVAMEFTIDETLLALRTERAKGAA